MTATTRVAAASGAAPSAQLARLLLVCSTCQHAWWVMAGEWDRLGSTGCPRCGGWTWLARLSYDALPAQRDGSQR